MKRKTKGRPHQDENPSPQRHGNWDIDDADLAVGITPEYGGVIEDFGKPISGLAEWMQIRYRHQLLMVLVVTVCVGFLMVVARDVYVGAISLKIFIDYVAYFFAAFGIVVGVRTYTK